jgi:hypothetical protein
MIAEDEGRAAYSCEGRGQWFGACSLMGVIVDGALRWVMGKHGRRARLPIPIWGKCSVGRSWMHRRPSTGMVDPQGTNRRHGSGATREGGAQVTGRLMGFGKRPGLTRSFRRVDLVSGRRLLPSP